MENNKGCRNKIFLFLGGTLFVAFLGVLGIMFDVIQIGQTGLIASQGNQANSTLIALQEEELYVQQRMLTAQSISGGLSTTEKGDGESPTSLPEYTSTITIPSDTFAPTNTQIPKPPPVTLQLPYKDTFDLRPRPEWESSIGSWRVVDNHLVSNSDGDWVRVFTGDPGWINYSIDVDIWVDDWFYPVQIIVRGQNDGYLALQTDIHNTDWILFYLGEAVTIGHSDTGVDDHLEGGRYERVYHLKVEVKDDIFTAYIDGNKILQTQDSTFAWGRVGLAFRTPYDSTWFDNFIVTELP